MEDKFITLAIHTNGHAMMLKRILEAHDIEVRLQKFVLSGVPVEAGVRVMIREKDVPLALKVTESIEHLETLNRDTVFSGKNGNLLIPVDFNDYCMKACKAGFDIASRLDLQPIILHAYPTPIFNASFSLEESANLGIDNSLEEEYNEIELSRDLQIQGKRKLKNLVDSIREEQKEGKIADLKFKTVLEDGVAEDVIKDYCRMNAPALVVMVTRTKEKKGEQLIGSVTAEVLDNCKVPVLSLPENCEFSGITNVKELVFFCNLDQHDLISMDTFMRMFEYPDVDITLVPLNEKQDKNLKNKIINLKNYFSKNYPAATFSYEVFPSKTFMLDFNNFESQRGVEMIVVPNRRRNAFMRLINPGIAHRLLFERDLPLLAIPIG